jgi:hypothetical protein
VGLYILKISEEELLNIDFEHVLNCLMERPKTLLMTEGEEPVNKDTILFSLIKQQGIGKGQISFSYLLERFENEFNEQIKTASKQNPMSPSKAQ